MVLFLTVPLALDGSSDERLPHLFLSDPAVDVTEPSEDLFGLGQQVTVSAPVADNAFVVAQSATISAPVQGDVFAVGQVVRIDAPVAGDVYAVGERVEVTGSGAVAGDVYVGAANLVLEGPIGGDVHGGAGEVELDGPIGGNVSFDVGTMILGPNAAIGGDLTYDAPQPTPGVEGAVNGSVRFTERVLEVEEVEAEPTVAEGLFSQALWTTWSYLAHLLVGFVFLGLGGTAAGRIGRVLREQPGRSLGLGFLAVMAVPVLSMLAIALVIPMPLGFLGLAGFVAGLYVAQVFTAQALGDQILRRFRPGAIGSPWVSMAVGLAPLVLLSALPWFGTLIWLVATCLGLGAAWVALRETATV